MTGTTLPQAPVANARVVLVEDDPIVAEFLLDLFTSNGIWVEHFGSVREFTAGYTRQVPECLIVDMLLPDATGLDVQAHVRRKKLSAPVLFLSGGAEVSSALQALRRGAVEFFEKPADPDKLLRFVRATLREEQRRAERPEQFQALDSLTDREREVLDLVVEGMASKTIAWELHISKRTVELHRHRIMKKVGVDSVAELVRLVLFRRGGPALDEAVL